VGSQARAFGKVRDSLGRALCCVYNIMSCTQTLEQGLGFLLMHNSQGLSKSRNCGCLLASMRDTMHNISSCACKWGA
jgi:hypothetical protein